jgi:hypothetical protein
MMIKSAKTQKKGIFTEGAGAIWGESKQKGFIKL